MLATPLSEKEVQNFIADYPWLLNFDYEKIPSLKNKGMEYVLSGSKRADLILRDRSSGRPVIVEFKKEPFSRDNIGQILEYKARIINEYTNDKSVLKDTFGDSIFTPILVLVVPECTAEARLACNLSNIDIYEYDKTIPEIMVPEKRKTLDEFIELYKNDDIPLSDDRNDHVKQIYNKFREVMEEENVLYGWGNYYTNNSEYFSVLNNLFINKCLFFKEDVSIGIYENIFSDSNNIRIEFYSEKEQPLKDFVKKYKDLKIEPINNTAIDEESYSGYCWIFNIDKKDFLNNTKDIVRTYVKNYIKVKEYIGNNK